MGYDSASSLGCGHSVQPILNSVLSGYVSLLGELLCELLVVCDCETYARHGDLVGLESLEVLYSDS